MKKDLPTKLALLIPCYNETQRLKIKSFQKFISDHGNFIDFYFIDDGSEDDTSTFLIKNFEGFSNFNLISYEENLGKGNAIREGIFHTDLKKYSYIGFIDADLDIPLEQVIKLYERIENSEYMMAISNRQFSKSFNFLKLRSYISILMVRMANLLLKFDPPIQDTQCGCKMFKTGIVDTCFKEPFVSDWLFDIEIFLRVKGDRYFMRNLIIEVESGLNDNNSKSSQKLLSSHKILFQILKIIIKY